MGEVVYVLGKTVSDTVCRSHANPLLRALTGYFARKPAIPCLGGAAHARISGLACELEGPGAHERGGVAPKVQTTSAKNADNGVSWVKWSAMQAQRHLASRVARTRTCYCEY